MIDEIKKALAHIKSQKPLILCLTNVVTVEFVANSLLSIGAAPIMSKCEDEVNELIKIASALYINIGTLDHAFIALAKKAIAIANKHHKPVIFDPVGSGATTIRTKISKSIFPFTKFIRGNSSEIISLASRTHQTYGVESNHTIDEAKSIAKSLSLQNKVIVIVSGPIDFITDGNQSIEVPFGSSLMQMVTGMGCSLTAIIAAFQSVLEDSFTSAVLAVHYFALCGELASQKQQSIGSFKVEFLDQLHNPDFAFMRGLYDSRR
ncbi:MAG: hydroxyethylthiazole kinase [Legionella sp.]